jgi:hypothetical protein
MLGQMMNPVAALVAEIAVIDSELGDELHERLAGQLAVLRVRAALERLSQVHPDARKDSSTDVPA